MERGRLRIKSGIIIRKSGDKTVAVQVERKSSHPKYKKVVKSFKKFLAHDEENASNLGDIVEIAETKHLSKNKFHRVVNVIGHSKLKLKELPKKRKAKEKVVEGEIKSDTTAN